MPRLVSEADPDRSTVYLFGHLQPQELALFNADEIRTDDGDPRGGRVEALGHGIGYWFPGCNRRGVAFALARGERILRLAVATYAALGGQRFRIEFTNWLEARGVVGYSTLMGFRDPRYGHVELSESADDRNRVLREAVLLAKIVDDATAAHRLALLDLHAALLDPGFDAVLYAYRAVEAVRQSITPGPGSDETWRAMHKRLGTEADPLKDLERVASAIRHADHDDPLVRGARGANRRLDLLHLAEDVVVRELAKLAGRDLLMFAD